MANIAIKGIMTDQIFTTFDAGKPQIEQMLASRYGDQYDASFLKLANMGREEAIKGKGWTTYEDNWIHETFEVKTTISDPTVGVAAEVEIIVGTNNSFYPRVGDIVTIPGTLVQAWISDVDVSTPATPVVTLVPVVDTDNIGVLTDGDILAITSGAFGEGTDQPEGTVSGTIQRDFQTQIIKETVGLDGSQFINELWFTKYDEHGDVAGYFTTGTRRAEYVFKLKTDGALMVGKQNDNSEMVQARVNIHGTALADTSEVRTTKGIIPWISELGNADEYAQGAYDLEDLDTLGLYLRSQGISSSTVYAPLGAKFYNDVQNATKDYAVDTTGDGALLNSIVSTMGKGNKEVATSLNFTYINRGNFSYALDTIDVFSHPKYLGATGYNMDTYGFFIPLKTVRDPKTSQSVDNIVVKYRSNDAYNRRAEMWSVRGAGGGTYVTSVDRAEWYLRGEIGLGMVAVNQMSMFTPASGS